MYHQFELCIEGSYIDKMDLKHWKIPYSWVPYGTKWNIIGSKNLKKNWSNLLNWINGLKDLDHNNK